MIVTSRRCTQVSGTPGGQAGLLQQAEDARRFQVQQVVRLDYCNKQMYTNFRYTRWGHMFLCIHYQRVCLCWYIFLCVHVYALTIISVDKILHFMNIILSGAVWILMDWRDGHSPPHGRSTQFSPTPERCQHHGNQHRLIRDAAAAGPRLPILHSHVTHGASGV